jgi:hypothetical protein
LEPSFPNFSGVQQNINCPADRAYRQELKMLGGNLLFATRGEAVDRHLFALAAMSDASHNYTDANMLQNWLSDVIGHLEALPEPTQIALGLALFKIGDEHFHWRADQIKSWHKERCRSLRQQLSELQREQWHFPVGALPSRFGAPSVAE